MHPSPTGGDSGLTLVLRVAFTAGLPARAWWGTGLVLNLGSPRRSRALPVWLRGVHAPVAMAGVVLLVLGGWGAKGPQKQNATRRWRSVTCLVGDTWIEHVTPAV